MYGMLPRLHADEIAPSGGAELAAELGAASADHLATPSRRRGRSPRPGCRHASGRSVATLLPATTWFLMKTTTRRRARFIDAGVPVALGTDFNPGTSPTANLPLAMTVACLVMRLTPDEALVAVTINAAHALGLGDESGRSSPASWRTSWSGAPPATQIPYWPGANLADVVVKPAASSTAGAADAG